MSNLERIGGGINFNLHIEDNPRLREIDFSLLVSLGDNVQSSAFVFENNPALRSVWVADNPAERLLTWCEQHKGICRKRGQVEDIFGNVVVRSDALPVNLTTIQGDLDMEFFDGEFDGDVRLPNLQTVNGSITSGNVDNFVQGSSTLTSINTGPIREVGGELELYSNEKLVSLNLPNIKSFGGDFHMRENDRLTNATMNSLESIGGAVRLVKNANITQWKFESLRTVKEQFRIWNHGDQLKSVICSELGTVGAEFAILENTALTETNFQSLEAVDGAVNIKFNEQLARMDLQNLQSVEWGFSIEGNSRLKYFNASRLESIGGGIERNLHIASNPMLEEVDFSNLVEIGPDGAFTVEENPNLHTMWVGSNPPDVLRTWCENNEGICRRKGNTTDINGVVAMRPNMTPITQGTYVYLTNNLKFYKICFDVQIFSYLILATCCTRFICVLYRLNGAIDFEHFNGRFDGSLLTPNLVKVTGDYKSGAYTWYDGTAGSSQLISVSSNSLQEIGGKVDFYGNQRLESLSLPNVHTIEEIGIASNGVLTDLNMAGLQTVRGSIQFVNNDNATHFDLPNLQSIGGTWHCNDNDRLLSINVPKVQNVTNGFNIWRNDELKSVNASGLVSIGGGATHTLSLLSNPVR